VHGQPGAPFQVADQRGAELRVGGQVRVVSGQAHQRGEPESLVGGDAHVAVVGEHGRVAAEPLGVPGRAAEHLAPPGGDVLAVGRTYTTGEQRAEQVVALNPVIEAADHPLDCRSAARPLIQCRHLAHAGTVTL